MDIAAPVIPEINPWLSLVGIPKNIAIVENKIADNIPIHNAVIPIIPSGNVAILLIQSTIELFI